MPAFRVTAHDGKKEYARRVVAETKDEAAQVVMLDKHRVLAVEEEVAPAPKAEPVVSQMTRSQLRGTIAWGVFQGLLGYALFAAAIILFLAAVAAERG